MYSVENVKREKRVIVVSDEVRANDPRVTLYSTEAKARKAFEKMYHDFCEAMGPDLNKADSFIEGDLAVIFARGEVVYIDLCEVEVDPDE